MKIFSLLLTALLIVGCTAQIPKEIIDDPYAAKYYEMESAYTVVLTSGNHWCNPNNERNLGKNTCLQLQRSFNLYEQYRDTSRPLAQSLGCAARLKDLPPDETFPDGHECLEGIETTPGGDPELQQKLALMKNTLNAARLAIPGFVAVVSETLGEL